jgi:alpha-N-acetylglucosamine transferase
MHADNSNMTTHAKLVEWIEHFVMSRKGIQAIFQRIINFDYYKLLERKNLLKPEIINLAYDPENLDDDSM